MGNLQQFIDQSLALCNNYVHTGQEGKAEDLLKMLSRVAPESKTVNFIKASRYGMLSPTMGERWISCYTQPLDGKSIEVFCDQGMGDIINMLRYLEEMKRRWDCRVVLNCYAHFDQMKDLMEDVSCVDRFLKFHERCDYHTNIFTIPCILNDIDPEYPPNFDELLGTEIPEQSLIEVTPPARQSRFSVGVVWRSNPNNILMVKKSMDVEEMRTLKNENTLLYSLVPGGSADFLATKPLENLKNTALLISVLDVVVSVDTAVLHLAGAMGKTTFALLPKVADVRWGKEDTTVWYPSVRLFRQEKKNDWQTPLSRVKRELALLA